MCNNLLSDKLDFRAFVCFSSSIFFLFSLSLIKTVQLTVCGEWNKALLYTSHIYSDSKGDVQAAQVQQIVS